MNNVINLWDTLQYSLESLFYTFLIKCCCQLNFLHLINHSSYLGDIWEDLGIEFVYIATLLDRQLTWICFIS